MMGHRRRLLGVMLLWALLPMPFLYVVLPPFWLVAVAAGLFQRARHRAGEVAVPTAERRGRAAQ